MNLANKFKLLCYALFLAGWWSGCSTAEDPAKPSVAAEPVAGDEEVGEEESAANDESNGANDLSNVDNQAVNETVGDEASSFENGDSVNFANDELEGPDLSNSGDKAQEVDMFGEALEEEKAASKSSSVPSQAEFDPTAADPSAFAAESTAANPTDTPTETTNNGSNMAALVAEANAASVLAGNQASNVLPVGEGSNMVPPVLQPTKPLPQVSATTPSAPAPAPIPSETEEVEPSLGLVKWVGYRINENNRQLKVEVFTEGAPEYEVYEEKNRAQQLELVVRFYQSKLRRKIRWSVDSSEFRSPVAFVRLREYPSRGIVDVVLTHRDRVLPQFYSSSSKLLFVYTIPERYFDKSKPLSRRIKDHAESLVASDSRPLLRQTVREGEPKRIGFQKPDELVKEVEKARPIREFMQSQARERIDAKGLPESFNRSKKIASPRTSWRWQHLGMVGVAQDDLEPEEVSSEGETNNSGNVSENESESESEGSANETVANEAAEPEESNGQANGANEEAIPVETITEGEDAEVELENGSLSNTNTAIENATQNGNAAAAANSGTNANATGNAANAQPIPKNAADEPFTNNASSAANFDAEQPTAAQAESGIIPAPNDIVGQANAGPAEPQYNGKPIFMEFYEAPLSLVLKSFSDETGNNFVFPSEIGQVAITVHFKGVPWDEALKAILETHSLGLVRIGQNVVRVDQIGNLTNYMAALEQAKQFETRRLPTKVLIFRLNNAVAKDIQARVTTLLARDVELDPRIKISDDERTNSLVMEAPAHVLAKAKNIIERLDLETPQVEIASRIVEVQKSMSNFLGFSWGNNFNFDPGRALGFGTLNFPNSLGSNFAVDPGVGTASTAGVGRFRFGSLNKFVDLDLLLKLEERKGTTNVLQSNRVLVLDGRKASILAGNSKFFRPAGAGITVPGGGQGQDQAGDGLAEVKFNLSLEVTPQVTAMSSVIMDLKITSDTPGTPGGQELADKSTRELQTQMVRASGDTGVIGGIYDTTHVTSMVGIPFLADIPIIGALFRSTTVDDKQTELLIMVTPNIISGQSKEAALADEQDASLRAANKQAIAPKTKKNRDSAIY